MLKALSNLVRRVAVADGSPYRDSFTDALYAAEVERHRSILDREDAAIPRNPRGFSIDDYDDSPAARGFHPLPEAARRMGLSEDETLTMCERSLLEAFGSGSTLYVRPAVVSILAARTRSAQEPLNVAGGPEAASVEFSPPEAA